MDIVGLEGQRLTKAGDRLGDLALVQEYIA